MQKYLKKKKKKKNYTIYFSVCSEGIGLKDNPRLLIKNFKIYSTFTPYYF